MILSTERVLWQEIREKAVNSQDINCKWCREHRDYENAL